MFETDLYYAVKGYFEALGYQVNGEIEYADVVAVKEDKTIIIELKKQLNLEVILQAIERQRLVPIAYIATLRKDRVMRSRRFKRIVKLLERLELGLLLCHPIEDTWFVEEYITPKPFIHRETKKLKDQREKLLEEFHARHSEQLGGVTGMKRMTAYREKVIRIATTLRQNGPQTIKQLTELGCDPKTGQMLRDNYYGWFRRVKRGVYELTEQGQTELEDYPDLVRIFIDSINKMNV